jgi:hypothetical protein
MPYTYFACGQGSVLGGTIFLFARPHATDGKHGKRDSPGPQSFVPLPAPFMACRSCLHRTAKLALWQKSMPRPFEILSYVDATADDLYTEARLAFDRYMTHVLDAALVHDVPGVNIRREGQKDFVGQL